MTMNMPVIFQFLKNLAANNNREWFNEHRDEYETARTEFENLLAAVISRIGLFDESIRGVQVKDCTYRIYRRPVFHQIKRHTKFILADISMLKEKNPIIVATMCIFRMVPACWQEEAFVYLLIF